jgi:hypothetical protein
VTKRQVLTPSFRKPRSSPPKSDIFSQEMHLKIPLQDRVWNFWILKHVVESQLFTPLSDINSSNQIWTFWHQTHSDKCFIFKLLDCRWTSFSLLESKSPNRGLRLSHNSQTVENDHLHIYSLWSLWTTRQESMGNKIRVRYNRIGTKRTSRAKVGGWSADFPRVQQYIPDLIAQSEKARGSIIYDQAQRTPVWYFLPLHASCWSADWQSHLFAARQLNMLRVQELLEKNFIIFFGIVVR